MSTPESASQVYSALDEEVGYVESRKARGPQLSTTLIRTETHYSLLFYGWELVLNKDGTYFLCDTAD
jgi:hypothetical protein